MSQPNRISVQAVHDKLNQDDSTLLVCVYAEEKYAASHLDGAISLVNLESKLDQLPPDAEIVFY